MKYHKEERSKILVLSVVLVLVVIYAVVATVKSIQRYGGAGGSAAGSATQASATSPPAGQGTAPGQTGARSPMLASLLAPVGPPDRDVFQPVIPPRWQQEAPARATEEPPKQTPPALVLPTPPPRPEGGGRAAAESLYVPGIIVGSPSVAVIRQGDTSYVLREGDPVKGTDWRVQSISRDSVTLRGRQGATFTLRGPG